MAKQERPSSLLSRKTIAAMKLICDGCFHEQIANGHPILTRQDFVYAAAEGLVACGEQPRPSHMETVKRRYNRGYERWTSEEEEQLRQLFAQGCSVDPIVERMQRNRGGIEARLIRLNLLDPRGDARIDFCHRLLIAALI